MSKNICFLVVVTFTCTLNIAAQTKLNFKVIGPLGNPVPDIYISYEDANQCVAYKTNNEGKLQVEVEIIPEIIFLSDSRALPVYGATSYIINQSKIEYDIYIPFYPKNKIEAALQLDDLLNTVSSAYGYYSAADFIQKGFTNKLNPHGLGVPGIFSVNPILTTDEDGKLSLSISGILADFIMNVYIKLTGSNYNYIMNSDGSF